MSHTYRSAAANDARQLRNLVKGSIAALTGKTRGPDWSDDPNRRVPHKHSYEENDPRAQPWRRIGDGSVAQGIAYRDTLIETADELRRQLWGEFPLSEIRRRRREREACAAELEELKAMSPADVPIGRPATLHAQKAEHDKWLALAADKLTTTDIAILRALLSFLDFATGRLFPSLTAIADRAGCHANKVINALAKLSRHGLIDWVRRTTRTGNAGEAGPQLEQTSNAYTLIDRRRMAGRTWHRYWQRLSARLQRLRRPVPNEAPPPAHVPVAPSTPYQAAFASLDASIQSATT